MVLQEDVKTQWENLNTVIDDLLGTSTWNEAMQILDKDKKSREVKNLILGRHWMVSRSDNLHKLKAKVRIIKRTMFCGPEHIFCVSVMPLREEHGTVPLRPTKNPDCEFEWDFELSHSILYKICVRALFDGSMNPLFLFGDDADAVDDREMWVGQTKSSEFEMNPDQELELYTLQVETDFENQILSLKDEDNTVILRLNFHSSHWKPGAVDPHKSHARQGGYVPEWETYGRRIGSPAEHGRLPRLLAALRAA